MYVLPKDGVQRAGDVVFIVIHCLFPQSNLHIGVTLKDRTKFALIFNHLPLKDNVISINMHHSEINDSFYGQLKLT